MPSRTHKEILNGLRHVARGCGTDGPPRGEEGVTLKEIAPQDVECEIGLFDQNGDVILSVGDTRTKMRVSSKVLSSASTVFASLLGPHFTEGRQLAVSGMVHITLGDDDPQAMSIIFDILHRKTEIIATNRLGSCADVRYSVALTCDKYDFIASMQDWSKAVLHKTGCFQIFHTLEEELHIAYLFNNEESFYNVTRTILLQATRPWKDEDQLEGDHLGHIKEICGKSL